MKYSGIKNKVAIVTGAGEGIGYTISELLLKSGTNVVANDINEERISQVASVIEK